VAEGDELRLLAKQMEAHLEAGKLDWRHRPDPITILPELVSLVELLAQAPAPRPTRLQAVLGLDHHLQPALYDLKRQGPHFALVGPPLSGKTTALFNWVFSLTERYAPEQVGLVLVDMQRKFVEYGGERKLSQLPHVLAVITEVEQVNGLLSSLKVEAETLANQSSGRSLFIIIDNFDDFSEEIESDRNLPRELAGLARRYGRDGLHFIIAGTLDSGVSDLRRRVQSANFGLGLRTAQSVETLRVSRTPAELRNKEFPVGRGFIVKSGQPSLLQVASPYEGMGIDFTPGESDDLEEKNAQAIDRWVERIINKYPNQQAAWTDGSAVGETATLTPQNSAKMTRMMTLLQLGLKKELEDFKENNGSGDLVTTKLIELDMTRWQSEPVLMDLLREVWINEQRRMGMPNELLEIMIADMDDESILLGVEGALVKEETKE
jgi:hypothetical protein